MTRALLCVVIASPLHAATLWVNNSGSPSCSDTAGQSGSAAAPFCSVTYGVTRMSGGDTLNIQAGTYTSESVVVNNLVGSAGTPSVIQSSGGTVTINCGGNTNRFNITNSSYLNITGLTVTNCNNGFFLGAVDLKGDGGDDHVNLTNDIVHDVGQECFAVMGNSTLITLQSDTAYNCNPTLLNSNGEGFYLGNGNSVDFGGVADNTNHVSLLQSTAYNTFGACAQVKSGTHDMLIDGLTCSTNYLATGFNDPTQGVIEVNETLNNGHLLWASNPNHVIRNNTINDAWSGIQLATGVTAYNNVVYGTNSAGGFWCLYARNRTPDTYTRFWYENTCQVTSAQAIGTDNNNPIIDSKNNIGPSTTNNLAYSASYFVNVSLGNFHLVSGAAPIGAGVNTLSTVPTDHDGVTRVNPPDIGAYQFVAATTTSGNGVISGNTVIR